MQIDCRNLDCPKPVMNTADAIKEMAINEYLEILLNSKASIANVEKFLKKNDFDFSKEELSSDEVKITLTKIKELKDEETSNYTCDIEENFKGKVILFKDSKIGADPIGSTLMPSFLKSILMMEKKDRPSTIICINQAVLMTTTRSHAAYGVLKELEKQGVTILNCGSCLEALRLTDRLGVGEISNAYEIMQTMLKNDTISL